jgi:ketosteroid isomerase-like protein
MYSMLKIHLGIAALSFFVVSCQPSANVDEIKKQIEEADARQVKAFQTKDLAEMTANYAPDAIILPQNSPMITGKENIDAMFREMLSMMDNFSFSMTHFDASGDIAYELGNYSGTFAGVEDKGKYLTVWKKQPDGKWMIAADIFNTDLAPSVEMH